MYAREFFFLLHYRKEKSSAVSPLQMMLERNGENSLHVNYACLNGVILMSKSCLLFLSSKSSASSCQVADWNLVENFLKVSLPSS